MNLRHILALALLTFALATRAPADVLIDLDASRLPAGEVNAWTSGADPTVNFTTAAPPRIEQVQGRAAIVFDGTRQFVAETELPVGFEKGNGFTVEVWALNPSAERAETLVAFAPPRGGSGTELNYCSGASAGAFRSGFKSTTPYETLPAANVWHHLAWSYGTDGTLRVYVDGELDTERALRVSLPAAAKLHIGASGEVDNDEPKRGFSGAIARVRIHNTALSQAELRKSAGFVSAFAPSPRHGASTDTLSVPLLWEPGSVDAVKFIVYAGTDRTAVERGEQPLASEHGPLSLKVGAAYFWRVTQFDKAGRVLSPGIVWTFTADPGLATAPQPRDNDSNVALTAAKLAWIPGKYTTQQRIAFSTNRDVLERESDLPATTAGWQPPALQPGTRYYWRVDSDNGTQPPSRGPVWTFRTQDAPIANDVTFFVSSDTHYGRENNAAINRRVIDEMNALPGTALPASIGGGFVRTPRGVVLNGDLLDEGFDKSSAPANWVEFCRDYGLTGTDGRLCFPLYEGFGNHDGGPVKSFVRAGIKERNTRRVGVKAISENGLHYAWDWDHLHLAQLNLFGGSGPADVKGVNGPEHDPEMSLEFLQKDLAQNVGASGRPVITFQHFAWLGGMSDWWHPEAKERFYEAVKPYRIACLINGHSHGAAFIPWHDLLTIHDGSTARGESDTGDFMVVRVTQNEVIAIQRKLGAWGIQKRHTFRPENVAQ